MRHRNVLVLWTIMLALLCGVTVARADRDTGDDGFFIDKAIAFATLMDRMAESEYFVMMSGASNLTEVSAEIGGYSYDAPSTAAVLTFDVDTLLREFMSMDNIEMPNLPDDIMALLRRRAIQAIPSMLNGQSGTEMLAAASVLTVGESYLAPSDAFVDTLVCLLYDDSPYAVVCPFVHGGEGIVSGTAMFSKIPEDLLAFVQPGEARGEAAATLAMFGVELTIYEASEFPALPSL